jgi:hypothetical protein
MTVREQARVQIAVAAIVAVLAIVEVAAIVVVDAHVLNIEKLIATNGQAAQR